jgi:hypothetical protein
VKVLGSAGILNSTYRWEHQSSIRTLLKLDNSCIRTEVKMADCRPPTPESLLDPLSLLPKEWRELRLEAMHERFPDAGGKMQ